MVSEAVNKLDLRLELNEIDNYDYFVKFIFSINFELKAY